MVTKKLLENCKLWEGGGQLALFIDIPAAAGSIMQSVVESDVGLVDHEKYDLLCTNWSTAEVAGNIECLFINQELSITTSS